MENAGSQRNRSLELTPNLRKAVWGFSFNINMRLENILREKIYAFSSNPETSTAEVSLLKEIAVNNHLGDYIGSTVLDNNDNYDSYRLDTSTGHFCAKVSLDPQDRSISQDFFALEQLVDKRFPYAICQGQIKDYRAHYSVSSFIYGQSCAELGKSHITHWKDKFSALVNFLAEKKINCRPFKEFLESKYLLSDITKTPQFKEVDFSKDTEILEICTTELLATKKLIQEAYHSCMESGQFCHGNIIPSRLLIRGQEFSLINFDDSYLGNPLIDLCSLKYEFFIQDDMEAAIINSFRAQNSFDMADYKKCAQIVKCMKFHDLVNDFIKYVYVYRGVKQRKILELTEKMSRSFGLFSGLPPFERHKDKIAELFTASVI